MIHPHLFALFCLSGSWQLTQQISLHTNRLIPRRFGVENLNLKQIDGCPGQICGNLFGKIPSSLLAGADPCAAQDLADEIIDAAKTNPEIKEGAREKMIEAAKTVAGAEHNSPPDSKGKARKTLHCLKKPKNSEIEGIVIKQDPNATGDEFFDPKTKKTIKLGEDPRTKPRSSGGDAKDAQPKPDGQDKKEDKKDGEKKDKNPDKKDGEKKEDKADKKDGEKKEENAEKKDGEKKENDPKDQSGEAISLIAEEDNDNQGGKDGKPQGSGEGDQDKNGKSKQETQENEKEKEKEKEQEKEKEKEKEKEQEKEKEKEKEKEQQKEPEKGQEQEKAQEKEKEKENGNGNGNGNGKENGKENRKDDKKENEKGGGRGGGGQPEGGNGGGKGFKGIFIDPKTLKACNNPKIKFGAGFGRRKPNEFTFIAEDQKHFQHGEALALSVITESSCDKMLNCGLDKKKEIFEKCKNLSKAVGKSVRDGAGADNWNLAFGFVTNFKAINPQKGGKKK